MPAESPGVKPFREHCAIWHLCTPYLRTHPFLNTPVVRRTMVAGEHRQELRALGRWVVVAGPLSLVAGGMESDVHTVSRRLGLGEVW